MRDEGRMGMSRVSSRCLARIGHGDCAGVLCWVYSGLDMTQSCMLPIYVTVTIR